MQLVLFVLRGSLFTSNHLFTYFNSLFTISARLARVSQSQQMFVLYNQPTLLFLQRIYHKPTLLNVTMEVECCNFHLSTGRVCLSDRNCNSKFLCCSFCWQLLQVLNSNYELHLATQMKELNCKKHQSKLSKNVIIIQWIRTKVTEKVCYVEQLGTLR